MNILRACAFLLLLIVPLRADPNEDLSFTVFNNIDLNSLAGGKVLQKSGGLINFPRGLVVQAIYVVDADPVTVQKKLVSWDPSSHPELKVWLHKPLPAKPTVADYSGLASLPTNDSIAKLRAATAEIDPDHPGSMQVSADEARLLSAGMKKDPSSFADVWSQVLAGRMSNYLAGTGNGDAFVVSDGKYVPLDEIRHLLHADTKVYGQFQRFFNLTPLKLGTAPAAPLAPACLYYECFDVDKNPAAMGTGVVYQHTDGTSIQNVDFEIYLNSGIYSSVELEQLWPVTIGGKNETLVWRQDMVSAPEVAGLSGSERLAAGLLMLQDVKQAVEAFCSEFKKT